MSLRDVGERQELALQVLELLNGGAERLDAIRDILKLLHEKTDMEAVGLRLKEGEDFPFYEVSGYEREFVESEKSVCVRDEDGQVVRGEDGKPELTCMCGAVLSGRFSPSLPCVTEQGSLWTAEATRTPSCFLPEDLPRHRRKACVETGFESIALVPVRSRGEIIGLLQFLDTRPERVSLEEVEFFEKLANSIGIGLERKRAEERLFKMFQQVRQSRDDHLSTLNLLRLGVLNLDSQGRVLFVNRAAERLTGVESGKVLGRQWTKLAFLDGGLRRQLKAQMEQPEAVRQRLLSELESNGDTHYWVDIEVRDDPVKAGRIILFLYDVTEVYDLRRMLDEQGRFHDLVGGSVPMKELYRRIREVAAVDFNVLVEGDTGTGKELVARAIHAASSRSGGPFVAVNCAGLSESLLTSQLFGHRRGAFTGAVDDHQGYFEAAQGGTLFLDEIGDISPGLQAMLLRVLEEKTVTRVGDTRARAVDVRIVAATHHDLARDAAQGRFRSDLLYRLRVARLYLPRLTERKEDIPVLVTHFLRQTRAVTGKPIEKVSQAAMSLLMSHDWPGNVRELKAAVEFACLHAETALIAERDLPPELRGGLQALYEPLTPEPSASFLRSSTGERPEAAQPDDEREAILKALADCEGNRTRAARRLGMSRATFYRRLTEYGLV